MIDALPWLVWIGLTVIAIALSRYAWRARQTYGLFRFLAFETLFALIALNIRHWFHEPLSLRQLISWVLLLGSIGLAGHGFYLLRVIGQAQENIIEGTQTIVQTGAYKYIRHPLYGALLLLGWGVFFKGLDWPSGILALLATVFLWATARCEESYNRDRFGAAYTEYMRRTKMFIPFLL